MSTKQCEDMLVGKGVRPTAARILVLQKLSERTSPASLFELEAELETLDKSTISRSLALLLEHHAIHSFEDGSGSINMRYARAVRRHAQWVIGIFIFSARYAVKPLV